MASSFYSRYVPPSQPNTPQSPAYPIQENSEAPRKRLKRIHNDEGVEAAKVVNAPPKVVIKDKKKKKKKKRKEESNDEEERLQPTGSNADKRAHGPALLDDAKHKKLRSKFEQASNVATVDSEGPKEDDEDRKVDDVREQTAHESPAPELHGLEPIPQAVIPPDDVPTTVQHLPEWLSQPIYAPSESNCAFEDLSLSTSTVQALEKRGYRMATAIQSAVLPLLLPGPKSHHGDLCIASGTGTGKTLAFIAPMVEALSKRPQKALRGLVVVPTREAVSQTFAIAEMCAAKSGLKICTAKGGKTISQERKLLIRRIPRWDPVEYAKKLNTPISCTPGEDDSSESDCSDPQGDILQTASDYVPEYESKADILICTPGRLVEHMQKGKGFNLDHIEWLVVDEMDRLMSQHYQNWAEIVINAVEADPGIVARQQALREGRFYAYQKRIVRKIVASATMTKDLSKLDILKLHDPKVVTLETSKYTEHSTENHGIEQTSAKMSFYQIPSTLTEKVVPISDIAQKPLQLLPILQGIFDEHSQSNIAAHSESTHDIDFYSESKLDGYKSEATSSDNSTLTSSSDDSASDNTISEDSMTKTPGFRRSTSGATISKNSHSKTSQAKSTALNGHSVSDATTNSATSGALIFTSTNENAMRLTRLLALLRPEWCNKIGSFQGSATSASRRKMLSAFRKRRLLVLIASNLASRSLNLTDLTYVVNYDIPTNVEMYIHRVGRTARAGKPGTAVTLLAHHEARWFWNDIARSSSIQRSNKVVRSQPEPISDSDQQAYEDALEALGEEAQGGRL